MKDLFNSYFYKISNLLGQNEPTFHETNYVSQESDLHTHLSYSDYVKFINEENK
jgi:hypothetical protein